MFSFYKKIIFSAVSLGFLVLPVVALAQASQPDPAQPATTQTGQGATGASQPGQGAASGSQPGQGEPAKNAAENINVKLQVPLPFVKLTGGKVANLKDYIEGVYKFLIGAGALLAVVMFIVAGYQWMISGGSADQTGAAKKRMWAAAMGLVLALLSFVILQTINEKLVKLELPKIDPVPGFFTGAEGFCNQNTKILDFWEKAGKPAKFLAEVGGANGSYNFSLDEAQCGKTYMTASGNAQCVGSYCSSGESCITGQGCRSGFLYGNIKWEGALQVALSGEGTTGSYVNAIQVYYLCDDNETSAREFGLEQYADKSLSSLGAYKLNRDVFIPKNPDGTINQAYLDVLKNNYGFNKYATYVPSYIMAAEWCEGKYKSKLKGFVLGVEVHRRLLDGNLSNDYFAVGKDCSKPIVQNTSKFRNLDFSRVKADELFQINQFNQGANCNFDITADKFPTQPGLGY